MVVQLLWTGTTSQDFTLAFDQALSDNKCIEGRSRKHDRDDFRGSSPAKKSALFEAQNALLRAWREEVKGDCKKKDGLISGKEERRRAEAKALQELDQQELESKETTQIVMDSYTVDANGNFIPRESGAHEITGAPSYKRVSPGVYLDSTQDGDIYMTKTLLECAGGRAGILENSPIVLDFLFSYDMLDDRAVLEYFDSNKGTGKGDFARLARIGTNGDYKSRDIFQIGARISGEVHEEYGRFDPPILESDARHVVAKKRISKGFLRLAGIGMFKWDVVKKTWYTGGELSTCISAANHRRADEWEAKAETATEARNFGAASGYKAAAKRWRSPDAIPSDGAVAVFFTVKNLEYGGDMKENVYCWFGVDATAHAASGLSVRDFVMSEKKKNIKSRNDYFEECKASGKCEIWIQFRGPHGSQESADEFYTEIYKVRLDTWVFEGKAGARRILKGEHRGLLHAFEAAASTVPGPTGGRVDVDNIRDWLSLDEGHASVIYGNDWRYSKDNMESWHGMFPGPWPENAGKMRVISYV